MTARKRPRKPASQPFCTVSGQEMLPLMRMPKKARRKNSKEVNWRARAAMIGVKTTTNIMPTKVPIAEEVVVRPSALPASPRRAIG